MAWFSLKSKNPVFAPFLTIFGHFCPIGIFSKNLALSHVTIYEPLTPCYVWQKTNEPILRKPTDRRKDRRKDRWALFYRTVAAEAGGPIIYYEKKEMIPLTDKKNKCHEKQKFCHICKKEFSTEENDKNAFKLFDKVRDHCHYTGKFRGAAHSICNLRYKTQKKFR